MSCSYCYKNKLIDLRFKIFKLILNSELFDSKTDLYSHFTARLLTNIIKFPFKYRLLLFFSYFSIMWHCFCLVFLFLLVNNKLLSVRLSGWSSGNVFVSGTGGLRFKSRAGQIRHSVANGLPPLRHYFERSCVVRVQ